ncbi:MAG: PH domain-containing protein [Nevskiales bacterium]|nr:PH domain-containing protein [Nevskiales bacterium]
MEQTYKSKVDTWLGVVLVGVMVGCLVAFFVSVRSGDAAAVLAALPILVIGAGLPGWLLASTHYTLGDTTLSVRSGPLRWEVPIRAIRDITPTSSPLSSPALSLDRLRIDYGQGRSVMISPKDKRRFIQALEARRAEAG